MGTLECPAGSLLIFGGTLPHRSLDSVSQEIRWSGDFRLHRTVPSAPSSTGRDLDWFYGLKDSLKLRDAVDPSYVPDWSSWANIDRAKQQESGLQVKIADFDGAMVGPWMDLWNIDPHIDGKPNRHLKRYLESPEES